MNTSSPPPLLIVEDDLALQKQIKWSIERFESVVASDRESALIQFRRHQPTVVTMDLGLPHRIRTPFRRGFACWRPCSTRTRTSRW